MKAKINEMLKYLRLDDMIGNWDKYIEVIEKNNLSHVKFLEYIISEEYKIKKEKSRRLKLAKAKIPEKYVIETYPFERQPHLNKKKILNMYDSFDYITKKRNIIWMGSTGTGKSGLATSFLIQAVNKGYNGFFILFPELIAKLYKSMADSSEEKVLKKFFSYDCLVIDEMGYVEMDPAQTGLFFTLMNKRHNKKTTLITTNLGFRQWLSFLKNEQLTSALIDRLTENSYIVNMKKCISIRSRFNQKPDTE